VRDTEGRSTTYPLTADKNRIVVGRLTGVELCYPEDSGLSRQHLAFTRVGGGWQVEDLGSKNGTLINGRKLDQKTPFRPGDRVSAGHLTIEFSDTTPATPQTVVFTEGEESTGTTTLVSNLDNVLGPQSDDLNKTYVMTGTPQMRALINAGRELAGHRPLEDVF